MRIENEMLSRFNSSEIRIAEQERTLSNEFQAKIYFKWAAFVFYSY